MNLLRSVDMLSNNRYYISTINNGGNNPHSISVPANTAQLKVTLYWNDPAAAVFASHSLVNDLDLEITSPSTVLPYKIRYNTGNVNNNATQATDHINNIEQIVINNPVNTTYTVNVKGTAVASGPQEYFVVYDIIPIETKLFTQLEMKHWYQVKQKLFNGNLMEILPILFWSNIQQIMAEAGQRSMQQLLRIFVGLIGLCLLYKLHRH
jgi:hypothetical protein